MNIRSMNEAQAVSATEKDAPSERGREEDRSPAAAEAAANDSVWPAFLSGVVQFLRPRTQTSREEFAEALLEETADGGFSVEERTMLTNILGLRELRASDVMIPRSQIDAVEAGSTLGELMIEFQRSGHSRMPVYGEDLDDPKGMVHFRDVLLHVVEAARLPGRPSDDEELDLGRITLDTRMEALGIERKVLFVPPSMLASDLMARMRTTRTQMALVIDEYGGTDGLVTLEDIIERVVGDIEDEHDDTQALLSPNGDGSFDVDARADLEDLRGAIGADFDISAHENDADTVGGMIFSELGRVPLVGERIEVVPGFAFEVLEADPRRLRRIRIRPLQASHRHGGGQGLAASR